MIVLSEIHQKGCRAEIEGRLPRGRQTILGGNEECHMQPGVVFSYGLYFI